MRRLSWRRGLGGKRAFDEIADEIAGTVVH